MHSNLLTKGDYQGLEFGLGGGSTGSNIAGLGGRKRWTVISGALSVMAGRGKMCLDIFPSFLKIPSPIILLA